MNVPEYEVKIDDALESALGIKSRIANCEEAVKAYAKSSGTVLTSKEMAEARNNAKRGTSIWRHGSYVREGVVCFPGVSTRYLFVRDSPVLSNVEAAYEAHKQARKYILEDNETTAILEYATFGNSDVHWEVSPRTIPTDKFGKDPLTVWLFKEEAEKYGLELKLQNIDEVQIGLDPKEVVDRNDKPYASMLWISNIPNKCSIVNYHDLDPYGSYIVRMKG
ncbi:hypothetical protein JW711_05115 [Candidatus Woesearchaeota archaeon]|nr:hypothetical protein [Candidatus Woesearchaeota archaeon]